MSCGSCAAATPVACEQGVLHHLPQQHSVREELDARHALSHIFATRIRVEKALAAVV